MLDNRVKNYLIRRTNKKRLYWVNKYAFKSVGDLVQYHYRNREPVCKEGYLLVKPCSKKEWQLNHEQVVMIAVCKLIRLRLSDSKSSEKEHSEKCGGVLSKIHRSCLASPWLSKPYTVDVSMLTNESSS